MKQLIILCLLALIACKTKSDYTNTIEQDHVRRNAVFLKPEQSPLDTAEIAKFKGLHFFAANELFRANGKITWLPQVAYLSMPFTNGTTEDYMQTAVVDFIIDGKSFQLPVYQNEEMKRNRTLFFPFTDKTSGTETYNGGRYLDLPYNDHHNEIIIDFNYAYFPFCYHTPRYSCPKVPKENYLDIAITAGEKL